MPSLAGGRQLEAQGPGEESWSVTNKYFDVSSCHGYKERNNQRTPIPVLDFSTQSATFSRQTNELGLPQYLDMSVLARSILKRGISRPAARVFSRGYAEAATSDKLRLSLALPREVCYKRVFVRISAIGLLRKR